MAHRPGELPQKRSSKPCDWAIDALCTAWWKERNLGRFMRFREGKTRSSNAEERNRKVNSRSSGDLCEKFLLASHLSSSLPSSLPPNTDESRPNYRRRQQWSSLNWPATERERCAQLQWPTSEIDPVQNSALHWGASTQSWYFVKHFWHVPPAVWLILQLLCSPFGSQNFQKKLKENITTEWTPHSVLPISPWFINYGSLSLMKRGYFKV